MRDAQQAIHQEHVSFHCDGHTLSGYLYKPTGRGPFPAVVWNHGSEKDPNVAKQFGTIAGILNSAGYVLFAPLRRGHGDSQGPYIVDEIKHERQLHGDEAADRLMVRLMEGPQLDDQLAGLKYLKTLPYVNLHRLGVMGASYGAIQALLGAESTAAGYKAAAAISPAAESWKANALLRQRLITAADRIAVPVLLIHPKKDVNLEPGYALGQEFERLGKAYGLMVFPPYGRPQDQSHSFGGAEGDHIWAPSVLQFLGNMLA
jgi:dipeptidyl aminopeptidase/acylaminoacyl peptidase